MIRHEAPSGAASQALFAEYLELVRARLGDAFVPSEEIFATEDDFRGEGTAWLVLYEGDTAVACGGLRPLAPRVGENQRMFVTTPPRPPGHTRPAPGALEGPGAAEGRASGRLHTDGS